MTTQPWAQSRAVVQSPFALPGNLPSTQPFGAEYKLDSSKVDVKLARALYRNVEPRYKLGAGFARAAINVPVGFMGVPNLKPEKGAPDEVHDILDKLVPMWSGAIQRIHAATMIDGETLARLRPANRSPAYAALFDRNDLRVELEYEPSESFEILHADEDLGAVTGIRVKHLFYVVEGGQTVERHLWETVTADTITIEYQRGLRPAQTLPNPLGFVPAVHFVNDSHRHELRGRSELEPLEPYLRFYNDVMLHAGAASKLHSTAKLVLRVQDVATFLANNFSEAEVTEGRLRFKDKDVLFFETGAPEIGVTGAGAYAEGAEVIQASAPLGDTNTLLEYIFLNIVDVSEVPEWAFGGAIASSKASVSEQGAPLVHKVNRKRASVENNHALLGRMALRMMGFTAGVTVSWDDLAQRDTKSEAEAIKLLTEALVALNDGGIVSKASAVEELRRFLPEVLPYGQEQDARTEEARLALEQDDSPIEDLLAQMLQKENENEQLDREAGIRANG